MPAHAIGRTHDCARFYPPSAIKQRQGGLTRFSYDVTDDGSIANMQIIASSGNKDLDDAAMACVTTQWRDTPAIRDGEPVTSSGHQALVSFRLD